MTEEVSDCQLCPERLQEAAKNGDYLNRPKLSKRKICWYVYASHFLSAWGDRMWQFGIGLFLVIISPESLRVTAVYGFTSGVATLLLGPVVGRWVDHSPRLYAARVSLVLQNMFVITCAAVLWILVSYLQQIKAFWPEEALLNVFYGLIICVAILANLASIANTISVEKDWIVVICEDNKDLFAATSATLKGIDLATNILAPILTGQVMTFWSAQGGALFIGGWNLVSVFVEFLLLKQVYQTVPALQIPKTSHLEIGTVGDSSETSCAERLMSGLSMAFGGWGTYMRYRIMCAGTGLACLYMTVLGFDNITVGYAYTQGISESVMGVLMAAGALIGIVGTLAYPQVRKLVGQVRSGLMGFSAFLSCLLLCVVSIWLPGSPFENRSTQGDHSVMANISLNNSQIFHDLTTRSAVFSERWPVFYYSHNETNTNINLSGIVTQAVTFPSDWNISNIPAVTTYIRDNETSAFGPDIMTITKQSFLSVGLLLAGIVGARFGLWMIDLTVTQIFLDHVAESERGVVMGVQTSLNQLMDMLKFALVVALPEPETFGYLILISFLFSASGFVLYAKFSHSVRGHILPFHAKRPVYSIDAYSTLS